MKDGFVSVATLNPFIHIGDVAHNSSVLLEEIQTAAEAGAKLIVSPELSLTGASCADFFFQDTLLRDTEKAVARMAKKLAELDALVVLGAPVRTGAHLYDCAVVLSGGRVLGLVPRRSLAASEQGLSRQFEAGPYEPMPVDYAGALDVPLGQAQLFACDVLPELVVGIEVGADAYPPVSSAANLALSGATLIVNPASSAELVGRADVRRELASFKSRNLACAYVVCEAGQGESSGDYAYAAHSLIAERGLILAETLPFARFGVSTEIDVLALCGERRQNRLFMVDASEESDECLTNYFSLERTDTQLTRNVNPLPFIPEDKAIRSERCEQILDIQAHGLARRMAHIKTQRAVIGVSGGLDSTLALLVCQRAFDLLGVSSDGILAVSMPGFGTTIRTKGNGERLCDALHATMLEIDITDAVRQHFADIGHDEEEHDATFENAQARERTQILMDMANTENGIVIGTGDLSELALGWATYNGDHMSMYGVNASIPKTLVRHLVKHVANTCENDELSAVLLDILDTPVSPELLPAGTDGSISQKTEDLIGPYELHDFFLFNMVHRGFSPAKTYRLAQVAFDGEHGANPYDEQTILKWLKVFARRFVAQQFKRSCMPDGVAVGSVNLSPRGGYALPSDASSALWLREIEALEA